jgi:hypothetical protein
MRVPAHRNAHSCTARGPHQPRRWILAAHPAFASRLSQANLDAHGGLDYPIRPSGEDAVDWLLLTNLAVTTPSTGWRSSVGTKSWLPVDSVHANVSRRGRATHAAEVPNLLIFLLTLGVSEVPQVQSHLFLPLLSCAFLFGTVSVPCVKASDSNLPGGPDVEHTNARPDFSDFTIVSRSRQLRNFPCSMCHQFVPPNPEPRPLTVQHPTLAHGSGDIWCGACHNMETPDRLSSGPRTDVVFDDAYLVCGRCHARQLNDWRYGGHGKRIDSWQGKRELHGCVHCHDPHAPAITPRKPQPPPPVRAGLERPKSRGDSASTAWGRHARLPTEADREQALAVRASPLQSPSPYRFAASASQDDR